MSEVFDIESLFDGIDKKDIPYNRPHRRVKKELVLMAGETTVHSFEVPFRIDETVVNFRAIYKLGLDVVLIKPKDECTDIVYDECRLLSIITWTLSPDETNIFRNTLLDAKVQLEFTMSDGSILYTNITKIKLEDSLENTYGPVPPINVGFGWTED